jgi:hypothetical protein
VGKDASSPCSTQAQQRLSAGQMEMEGSARYSCSSELCLRPILEH